MEKVDINEVQLGWEVVDRSDLNPSDPDFCAHYYDFGHGCPECGNTTVLAEVDTNGQTI